MFHCISTNYQRISSSMEEMPEGLKGLVFQRIIICHIGKCNINHLSHVFHYINCDCIRVIARQMVIYLFIPVSCPYFHSPVSCHTENNSIAPWSAIIGSRNRRSEEHTSELQS